MCYRDRLKPCRAAPTWAFYRARPKFHLELSGKAHFIAPQNTRHPHQQFLIGFLGVYIYGDLQATSSQNEMRNQALAHAPMCDFPSLMLVSNLRACISIHSTIQDENWVSCDLYCSWCHRELKQRVSTLQLSRKEKSAQDRSWQLFGMPHIAGAVTLLLVATHSLPDHSNNSRPTLPGPSP